MIMKYINMDFSENDSKLDKIISGNETYKATAKAFSDSLDLLDKKVRLNIDDKVSLMEAIARDTCYDEGFSEGVKFILGCISSGKKVEI